MYHQEDAICHIVKEPGKIVVENFWYLVFNAFVSTES